jgi:outer membrane protein TolC
VLVAERVQLVALDAFADARSRCGVSVVALYRALAGGWPGRMPMREKIAQE